MVRILHVHGAGIDLARVADYPYDVLSVSDRLAGNPGLAELRRFTDKCLMGGIDETRLQERSLPLVQAEIDDAIAQAGRDRLILSPGCTVPSFTPMQTLSYVLEYTRTLNASTSPGDGPVTRRCATLPLCLPRTDATQR